MEISQKTQENKRSEGMKATDSASIHSIQLYFRWVMVIAG